MLNQEPVADQALPNLSLIKLYQFDGSGIITSVGPGVDKERVADESDLERSWQRPNGTFAEYISLPSEQAVLMPDNMSFETGAYLSSGLTSAYCTLGDGTLKDKTVFISGGAGAVGHNCI